MPPAPSHLINLPSALKCALKAPRPSGIVTGWAPLLSVLAPSGYAAVVFIEVTDGDATQVQISYAVDGDTITLADGRRVRLMSYDTYELSEPLGPPARAALEDLCRDAAYSDVDNYEPFDNYGRVLGYLWCPKTGENRTWHVSVQNYFIAGEGARYVKRLLHILPDEHPYAEWTARHVVVLSGPVEIYVTTTPNRHIGCTQTSLC